MAEFETEEALESLRSKLSNLFIHAAQLDAPQADRVVEITQDAALQLDTYVELKFSALSERLLESVTENVARMLQNHMPEAMNNEVPVDALSSFTSAVIRGDFDQAQIQKLQSFLAIWAAE